MTATESSTIPDSGIMKKSSRIQISRGMKTMLAAVIALFLFCKIFVPDSASKGAILGMLPFAAVLAIIALGQTLVIQQGGIDLSVAGSVSLAVVYVTRLPQQHNNQLWKAVLVALGSAVLIFAVVARVPLVGKVTEVAPVSVRPSA